ncbi:hypothetical protein M569_00039 [Genlisea aurea]|uniref:Uncharacterized protein n=1 Tax=Genlisea aurea TaxID=192259 RepID=S8D4L5_9LAMI|nr:hypothetical protein M569_00039 [Genlisea aurea]
MGVPELLPAFKTRANTYVKGSSSGDDSLPETPVSETSCDFTATKLTSTSNLCMHVFLFDESRSKEQGDWLIIQFYNAYNPIKKLVYLLKHQLLYIHDRKARSSVNKSMSYAFRTKLAQGYRLCATVEIPVREVRELAQRLKEREENLLRAYSVSSDAGLALLRSVPFIVQ